MGVTTRSGFSTEPNDPTPSADNRDLWALLNHPERWEETFYTNFLDSDKEEDEIIRDENSTVADGGDEPESIANAMEIDDEMKDGDGTVGGDEIGEVSWDYMERDGHALFKGKELDNKSEGPIEHNDEADGDISDPSSDTTDAGVEDSFAAFIQDVGKQENSLRSNAADYGSDVGETDDEDAGNPQSYSADDNAQQIENLDPSIGKERGKQKCTCS